MKNDSKVSGSAHQVGAEISRFLTFVHSIYICFCLACFAFSDPVFGIAVPLHFASIF